MNGETHFVTEGGSTVEKFSLSSLLWGQEKEEEEEEEEEKLTSGQYNVQGRTIQPNGSDSVSSSFLLLSGTDNSDTSNSKKEEED